MLKLAYGNFTHPISQFYTNSLPLRQSTVEESSSLVSHHSDCFYAVLTISGVFQHEWVVGAGGRRDNDFNFLKEKGVGMH